MRALGTASGLHLGMTPSQAIAILGPPSSRRKNALIYSLDLRKRNPPDVLRQLRRANPGVSDDDFRKNFEFYDHGESFVARFAGSKLTYLSGSLSGTD